MKFLRGLYCLLWSNGLRWRGRLGNRRRRGFFFFPDLLGSPLYVIIDHFIEDHLVCLSFIDLKILRLRDSLSKLSKKVNKFILVCQACLFGAFLGIRPKGQFILKNALVKSLSLF